jgi:hypothetical protein
MALFNGLFDLEWHAYEKPLICACPKPTLNLLLYFVSGYYHELFLKGRSGLCVNMKRTKVKGNQKLKRDPETEPK